MRPPPPGEPAPAPPARQPPPRAAGGAVRLPAARSPPGLGHLNRERRRRDTCPREQALSAAGGEEGGRHGRAGDPRLQGLRRPVCLGEREAPAHGRGGPPRRPSPAAPGREAAAMRCPLQPPAHGSWRSPSAARLFCYYSCRPRRRTVLLCLFPGGQGWRGTGPPRVPVGDPWRFGLPSGEAFPGQQAPACLPPGQKGFPRVFGRGSCETGFRLQGPRDVWSPDLCRRRLTPSAAGRAPGKGNHLSFSMPKTRR
ncbi:uncharacterized protein LOC141959577 [Athene noctua]|uniref:uncharacterized protein LOC141959577 n=1 Tax=Athene noctua TaxID=126797 RepID=UPI003EBE888C